MRYFISCVSKYETHYAHTFLYLNISWLMWWTRWVKIPSITVISVCLTQQLAQISLSTWASCCVPIVVIGHPLRAWSCRFTAAGFSPFTVLAHLPCPTPSTPSSTNIHTGITIHCSHFSIECRLMHNLPPSRIQSQLQPFPHGCHHFTVYFAHEVNTVACPDSHFIRDWYHISSPILGYFCHSYDAAGQTSQISLILTVSCTLLLGPRY